MEDKDGLDGGRETSHKLLHPLAPALCAGNVRRVNVGGNRPSVSWSLRALCLLPIALLTLVGKCSRSVQVLILMKTVP